MVTKWDLGRGLCTAVETVNSTDPETHRSWDHARMSGVQWVGAEEDKIRSEDSADKRRWVCDTHLGQFHLHGKLLEALETRWYRESYVHQLAWLLNDCRVSCWPQTPDAWPVLIRPCSHQWASHWAGRSDWWPCCIPPLSPECKKNCSLFRYICEYLDKPGPAIRVEKV